jgi:hypothetical protein
MMDDLFEAQTVDLELSKNEILTVRAIGHKTAHQWSYEKSKGEFSCKEGMLSLPKGGNMSGDNVASFGSGADDLYVTDSHLIINSHGGTAGIILLIPNI